MAKAIKEPKPEKEKVPLTDEQKKNYAMLGVVGVLALITAAIYVPPLLSSKGSPAVVTTTINAPLAPNAPGKPPTSGAPGAVTNPAPGAGAPPAGAPSTGGTVTTGTGAGGAPLVPIAQYRPDPMQPFYTVPNPPNPTPTPIPPVPLPLPDRALLPTFLPAARAGQEYTTSLAGLPQARIASMSSQPSGPQVSGPPKRQSSGTEADSGEPAPSFDKRLSGVIIGDGIRALLEITTNSTGGAAGPGGKGTADKNTVTRVVQPGDEVDGINVISIYRTTVGNQTVTRMLVRENNELHYVDLKPSLAAKGAAGGAGAPGAPTP